MKRSARPQEDERFIQEARRIMDLTLSLTTPEQRLALQRMTIGERIQWIQEVLNEAYPGMFSIHKISRRAGSLSAQALWRIMTGETSSPGCTILPGLARALGVSVEFLVTGVYHLPEETPSLLAQLGTEWGAFLQDPENLPYIKAALTLAKTAREGGLAPSTILQVITGLNRLNQRTNQQSSPPSPPNSR